jgi:hypothetical protein
MVLAREWWRRSLVLDTSVSNPASPRRPRTSSALITGILAAASSMARGSPSSRRQIPVTATIDRGSRWSCGRLTRARWTNSVAASSAPSGSNGQSCSPSTDSASRLVVRTTARPHLDRSRSTSAAVSASTCSQLSRTSSTRRSDRYPASASPMVRPARGCTPSSAATARLTPPPVVRDASSHSHTPAANRGRSRRATSTASLDFPTPPTPVMVTRRPRRSAAETPDVSSTRPTRSAPRRGRVDPAQARSGTRSGSWLSSWRWTARVGSHGSTPSSDTRCSRNPA